MTIHTLVQEQILPITMQEAWEFFSAPSNLDAITPPVLDSKSQAPESRMYEGQIITYRVKIEWIFGFRKRILNDRFPPPEARRRWQDPTLTGLGQHGRVPVP